MHRVLAPFTALAVAIAAAPALALDVGEKAPEIDVSSWVQGDPVVLEQEAGKKPVVVAFWASFSDPSKKAIPVLNKIALKYKDTLDVVAISAEKAEDVKEFAKDGKFKCRVACDAESNTTAPWTKGIRGDRIPHVVVLDKTGAVVWRGSDLEALQSAVDKVVAGKLDGEKAKKIDELASPVEDGLTTKDVDQASGDADKLLETDPGHDKGLEAKFRLYVRDKESPKLKAFLTAQLAKIDDDWYALNWVAWKLATMSDLAYRQPTMAIKAARRAAELTGGTDAAVLDTLARTLFEAGMLEAAIETQTKAAAVEGADDAIKATLGYYQACVEARKEAASK